MSDAKDSPLSEALKGEMVRLRVELDFPAAVLTAWCAKEQAASEARRAEYEARLKGGAL